MDILGIFEVGAMIAAGGDDTKQKEPPEGQLISFR